LDDKVFSLPIQDVGLNPEMERVLAEGTVKDAKGIG